MTDEELAEIETRLGPLDTEHAGRTLIRYMTEAENARTKVEGLITPRLPDFDAASIRQSFPDTANDAQARLVHATLLKVQQASWRNPDMPLERVIGDVTRTLSKDEIVALPDSLRITLLLGMSASIEQEFKGGDRAYMNEQRFRLALGYDHADMDKMAPVQTDVRRTLSFSPALANWQSARELEYLKKEAVMFKDNPELAEIRSRWQADPKSVPEADKMRLMEAQHKLHADAYGYAPGAVYKLAQSEAVAMAQDLKFGSTVGLITINPGALDNMPYGESRALLLHESDHLAQHSWIHAFDNLSPNDPRREFVLRFAAFEMMSPVGKAESEYGGLSVEGMIIYFARPGETHAYLLHDPSKKPSAAPAPDAPAPEPLTQKPTCLPSLCN